ncbi:hypothetical protein RhiirB3_457788 [Rhizophagus irregularis]|nr:hypothetical protein RhiirB3_457788 [Rhizophagus irregularis]
MQTILKEVFHNFKFSRIQIPAHQHIAYERIPTQQIEGNTYNLKERKYLKHIEQWSIALGKTRQYIN